MVRDCKRNIQIRMLLHIHGRWWRHTKQRKKKKKNLQLFHICISKWMPPSNFLPIFTDKLYKIVTCMTSLVESWKWKQGYGRMWNAIKLSTIKRTKHVKGLTSFDEVRRTLASREWLLTMDLIFLKEATTDIGTVQ